jgi:hypothetical protein
MMLIRMMSKKQIFYALNFVRDALIEGFFLPKWMKGIGARLVLMMILIGVSLGYVIQLSKIAVSGYETTQLEKERDALIVENKKLDAEVAEFSSLDSIYARLEGAGMESVRAVKYVTVGSEASSVAKK